MFLRKRYIIILAHILLWAILGFIYIAHVPLTIGLIFPTVYWIKQSVIFLLLIGLYYWNERVLVPGLLYKQKRVKFIMLHIAIIALLQTGGFIYDGWAHLPEGIEKSLNDNFEGKLKIKLTGLKLDTTLLLTACLLVGLSTSISITRIWQRDLLKSQQLVQKQLDSELSFLKAQIHPHFFFNTLNNIYALSFIDVESSRASLHKLSRMMRYLLYETQNDRTSLKREVNFVKDYIELMQLRVNGHTHVKLEESLLPSGKMIAPMILLPFVENAFKHGVHSVEESWILIKILQTSERLILEVENTLFPRKVQRLEVGDLEVGHFEEGGLDEGGLEDGSMNDGGIGITNTRRRLDLIYAGQYRLHLGPEGNKYSVRLELEL